MSGPRTPDGAGPESALRLARPVRDLDRASAMYAQGLDLVELGRFEDHAGFDGVMLGRAGLGVHLELTHCRTQPITPSPTPEDLLVLYVEDAAARDARCAALRSAGFDEVEPFNPYWSGRGRTFADPDGYRLVVAEGTWPPARTA